MNIKQMLAFKELMLTGSMSKAASNLHRSQPAISHLIKTLEDELNMKLFVREGKRLTPVPETKYLLEECNAVLRRIEVIGENLDRMKAMELGELRIVSSPGPAAFLMPTLISRHVAGKADIKTTLLSRSSEAVRQLIGSQQFDVGLADHDPDHPSESTLLNTEIFTFNCLCALHEEDPLSQKEFITINDLSGKPMASLYRDHVIYKRTQLAFASASAKFDMRFETNSFIHLLTFVRQGLARAIVDPLTAEAYRLYSNSSQTVIFRHLNWKIEFSVEKLIPGYRPASIIANSFSDRLSEELIRLGGRTEQEFNL